MAEVLLQKLLARVRKAVEDYDMIQDGDRIGIGIHGKQSCPYVLFKDTAAVLSQKFERFNYNFIGNEGFDIPSLIDIYKSLNIQYHIEDTSISKVFSMCARKKPCSLCSNMKRGNTQYCEKLVQ